MQLLFSFVALVLSLLSLSESQPPPTVITYSDCSSAFCLTCSSQYLCSQCSTNDQPLCCPKYCLTCSSMNICLQCETHFYLKQLNPNTIVCRRAYTYTDPFYNTGTNTCNGGYYLQSTTNSCLDCNVPNCALCTGYKKCANCTSSLFVYNLTTTNAVNQTVFSLVCQPCIPNCLSCTSITSCTTCAPKYYPTTYACQPCQTTNCLTCSNNGITCTSCVSGCYLNPTTSTCSLCSYAIKNCSTCTLVNNLPQCKICATGFIYNQTSNTCIGCPANCYYCQILTGNTLNCTNCSDGYTYNNITDTCVSCGIGCQFCDFVNTTSNNCSNCTNGYAQMWDNDTQTFKCVSCQFPCVQCTNDSICIQCETGFFLNFLPVPNLQIGQCYFCNIENCISCETQTNCTLCEDGYYIKLKSDTQIYGCSPCPGQCAVCSVSNVNLNSVPKCTQCLPHYTLEKGNNCVQCKVKNCSLCNSTNFYNCFQCANGFYSQSGSFSPSSSSPDQCLPCKIDNCIICNSTGNDNTTANCLQCSPGFYLVVNTQNVSNQFNQCSPCPPNCFSCSGPAYCTQCKEGYEVVIQANKSAVCRACPPQCLTCLQNKCLFCAEGFYPTVQQNISSSQPNTYTCNSCVVNLTGCVSCFNGNFCRECTPQGFSVMPNTQGNCVTCGYGCISCDNQQICSSCSAGFLLNTQTNSCMDVAGVPGWGLFVIISFGGALIFTLIEKFLRYRNKKTERKEELLLEIGPTQRPFEEMEGRTVIQAEYPGNQRNFYPKN